MNILLCPVLKVLLTIIEVKMGQNERRSKFATFLLNYLRYRDSSQIMFYIDFNRIKGSFDQESVLNAYTGPLRNY